MMTADNLIPLKIIKLSNGENIICIITKDEYSEGRLYIEDALYISTFINEDNNGIGVKYLLEEWIPLTNNVKATLYYNNIISMSDVESLYLKEIWYDSISKLRNIKKFPKVEFNPDVYNNLISIKELN